MSKAQHTPLALIVGYNEDETATLASQLEQHGWRTSVANETARGLALAKELGPSIIFHDIKMPLVDGLTVASMLRSDPRYDKVFLVSLGGPDDPPQRERSKRAGFNIHLIKPISPEVVRLM